MSRKFSFRIFNNVVAVLILMLITAANAREADVVLKLWDSEMPGPKLDVDDERDFTKDTDKLIAGRRIIKLGNVKDPEMHVYFPDAKKKNGASVIICPGGGFTILAWDLEGTEVADYFNTLGITAIVLKYRVPTRTQDTRWLGPVQDAQRAIRLTRHHASDWKLDRDRVGILGFSAGGKTAGATAFSAEPYYESIDDVDKQPIRPDLSMLIYCSYKDRDESAESLELPPVTSEAPPVFIAHAADDSVNVSDQLSLGIELDEKGIPFDLHVYSQGGHGYGLRITEDPVTTWHLRLADWLRVNEWIAQ
ncbi:MAG: alpha/beta hydrolase [Puniceicoccaceae bacterium]